MTGKRKPPPLCEDWPNIVTTSIQPDGLSCFISGQTRNAKQARRLAAWLLKFADWADSKSKGGEGMRLVIYHFGVQGLDGELRAICGVKAGYTTTIWERRVTCKRCLARRKG